MTPDAAIAMLDRTVARHGQTVILRRATDDLTARGFVRDYKPEEIVGGIAQGDTNIALSPTQIAGSQFDAAPIRRNDKVVIRGRVRNVEAADFLLIDDRLVRINLQVRG
ncbi:hypothetical protein [Kaistia sp. MMO-174]|uniref:hypothetical protein n=1 Tax=Kaistia sp. MMO-174 TaxID=3081256 RepID=UPI00301719B3